MRRAALLIVCASIAVIPGLTRAHVLARTGCQVLPRDNPWNQRVDRLPVAAGSDRLVAAIGLVSPVHPDFGAGLYNGAPIGIPYALVSRHTRRVPVRFTYAGESDGHRYPIPPHVPIEGGSQSSGDRHVILVDRGSCGDSELFAASPQNGGVRWTAGSGAIFNLRSDRLRPAGWTSAGGAIDHALRFTAPRARRTYVYPARHSASSSTDPSLPPMGLRVRLNANVSLADLPHQARVVALALKRYGMLLADNGSPWYISGAPDWRWNNDALHLLDRLHGRDFEVVDTRALPRPGL
ncbi:MAG: hypothetical protein ACR2JH_11540 [Solirubrobacteraceae bacterium]